MAIITLQTLSNYWQAVSDWVTGANSSYSPQTSAKVTSAALSSTATMQNAATATGVGTALTVSGNGVAVVELSGSFSATVTWQGQGPGGGWYNISGRQRGTGSISTTATATGVYDIDCRGLQAIRANITSYTSGNVTATGVAQPLSAPDNFVQAQLTGSTVADSQSLPFHKTGNNVLVGNYSLTWAASAASGTTQTATVPLPSVTQGDALYLVSVNNPSGLGTTVTVNFNNMVNFGSGAVTSTVTSVDVPSGAIKSYLVQGWLLGDASAQISASNDAAASAGGGTVQVQVRKV